MAAPLTCPKCAGEMRSYERNGVHVDQCSECRGIFLDRGELERLMQAEGEHYAGYAAPAAAPAQQPIAAPAQWQQQAPQQQYRGDDRHGHGHRKKRKGFLSDILDFD